MSNAASPLIKKLRTLTAMSWTQRRRRVMSLSLRTGKLPFYPLYFPVGLLLARFGVRFFSNRYLLPHIGHLSQEPDFFIRAGRAGLQPEYTGILLIPSQARVANHALLEYWSRHPQIRVIKNRAAVLLLWPFTWMGSISYYNLSLTADDGTRLTSWPANDYMLREDHRLTGGSAVLQITDEDQQRGRVVLDGLGVPQDAWWVCLHVRHSPTFQGMGDDTAMRDADPGTYMAAVDAIVERGGWVFRLGNPGMPPFPESSRVVDYANHPIRADWMDIFLISGARFFLGCDSGPMVAASVFGTPVAAANYVPMGHGVLLDSDIYIPKLYRSLETREFQTFPDVLGSNKRDLTSYAAFVDEGIEWVDNSSEEILSVAKEMMDRLDGASDYSPEDEDRQARYKTHFRSNPSDYTFGDLSRVGRDFLRKYEWLL